MESREEQVYTILAEVSGHDREKIRPGMELVAELGIDSPKALELLVEIEERLGVEISDEEAEELETVSDVLERVAADS